MRGVLRCCRRAGRGAPPGVDRHRAAHLHRRARPLRRVAAAARVARRAVARRHRRHDARRGRQGDGGVDAAAAPAQQLAGRDAESAAADGAAADRTAVAGRHPAQHRSA